MPESAAFSRAAATDFFDASTCTMFAPLADSASVPTPV
jgi:hypothetical protein